MNLRRAATAVLVLALFLFLLAGCSSAPLGQGCDSLQMNADVQDPPFPDRMIAATVILSNRGTGEISVVPALAGDGLRVFDLRGAEVAGRYTSNPAPPYAWRDSDLRSIPPGGHFSFRVGPGIQFDLEDGQSYTIYLTYRPDGDPTSPTTELTVPYCAGPLTWESGPLRYEGAS